MTERASFSAEEAKRIGEEIGIDWSSAPFDVEQFRMGMDVELEHGLHDLLTNVTDSDPTVTGKIALAHLSEFPDYYTRLARMEKERRETTKPSNGRRSRNAKTHDPVAARRLAASRSRAALRSRARRRQERHGARCPGLATARRAAAPGCAPRRAHRSRRSRR